ncbi:MAG: metallophosphoesterase, partial [Candidatus Fimenecus sp.]
MKPKKQIYKKNGVLLTFTCLAALAAAVQYAFRINYVFVDIAVFNGLSALLMGLSVVIALVLLALTTVKLNRLEKNGKLASDSRVFSVLTVLSEGLAVFFVIYNLGNLIGAGEETTPVMLKMFAKGLPLFLGLCTVAFLLCIYPAIQKGALKKCIAVVLVLGVLGSTLWTLLPYCNYKMTAAPMVIDSGENYAVVFATNDTGTGFVEYSYHGETYTLYDESAGRLKGDSKIHTVKVPKTHLEGNTYRVGSTRILEERSYGGRSGKTVYSAEYTFTVPTGDTQTYLSVSDWHTRLQKAYDAVSYVGDYDGVILLGDAVPGLMFEDEIVENIVEFGGAVSGGTKPVIYVRGNHETRGGYAAKLADYLGLDGFYFETAYGDYNFLVLDSGEDKPDNHPEY